MRRVGMCLLVSCLMTPSWAATSLQFQLPVDAVTSGGQLASSAQFGLGASVIGEAVGGQSASAQFTLRGGAALTQVTSIPPFLMITVTGTVDDAFAAVTVNGSPATVSGTTWSVSGILLYPGPNTLTAVARDVAGNVSAQQILVYFDALPIPHTHTDPRLITVTGTLDDPSASVTLNLVHHGTLSVTKSAAVTGTTWQVLEMPLYDGSNTLTATARDPAGNTSLQRIWVFVDASPPARPTVEPPPVVTTASSHTFTGTKRPGTSVWMNGKEVVPVNPETTWTATVPLNEGDNPFAIVTKDAVGNVSSSVSFIIVVDNLPPVVTITEPPEGHTTNFTTVTVRGTMDDHLTTVTVAGMAATRNGLSVEVVIPLPEIRAYALTLTATSPNGYVTTQTLTVTRGTIPTLVSVSPRDGAKGYWDQALSLSIVASDPESDPLEYQFIREGVTLREWDSASAASWTPSVSDAGVHRFEFHVRDAFGGFASETPDVLILRPPVNPP